MVSELKMIKILFLIHDLGQGGAEKVLINLVNNMDRSKFDISVTVLFGGGVNEQFLKPDIHFRAVFSHMVPGNSKLMKLLSPEQLHRLCVKEKYDIEVSYLEGPSARVISGCQEPDTKRICWIHSTMASAEEAAVPFRNVAEARRCYGRFHRIVGVSRTLMEAFHKAFPENTNTTVLYNTVDAEKILELARKDVPADLFNEKETALIATGTLKPVKAFDRLIRIHSRLRNEGYPVHTYVLGKGPEKENLTRLTDSLECADTVSFLGYDVNPYRYLARSQLFVCSSFSEGFSTAATEALIVGTPVCTVEVSGMKEMLGEHNEYGLITENSEEALYQGIKSLLDDPELMAHYKKQAELRGRDFSTQTTTAAVETELVNISI